MQHTSNKGWHARHSRRQMATRRGDSKGNPDGPWACQKSPKGGGGGSLSPSHQVFARRSTSAAGAAGSSGAPRRPQCGKGSFATPAFEPMVVGAAVRSAMQQVFFPHRGFWAILRGCQNLGALVAQLVLVWCRAAVWTWARGRLVACMGPPALQYTSRWTRALSGATCHTTTAEITPPIGNLALFPANLRDCRQGWMATGTAVFPRL